MDKDLLLVIHSAGGSPMASLGSLEEGADPVVREQAHDPSAPMRSSSLLVPLVAELLEAAGARWEELRAVGAVVGPGSFTGIKVGCAFAWGLAEGLALPVLGVDSLEVLAESVATRGATEHVHALIAGVRASVYEASYRRDEDGGLRPLLAPRLRDRDEALADLEDGAFVVYDASGLRRGAAEASWWRSALGRRGIAGRQARGADVAAAAFRLCARRYRAHGGDAALEPLYLRRTWAEEARETRS